MSRNRRRALEEEYSRLKLPAASRGVSSTCKEVSISDSLARPRSKLRGMRSLCMFMGRDGEKMRNAVRDAFVVNAVKDIEVLVYPALDKGNIADFVECEGLENLDEALWRGKGAMLVFAHFGSNQMIMPAIGYRGYRMSQVSAPPTVWEEKLPGKKGAMWKRGLEIRWRHEQSLPVTHINVFGTMKEVFLCLRRNEVLGIAMDGGGGRKRVAAEFLGGRAFFSTGAMEIAERTRCAVLPAFNVREGGGRHRLVIEPSMGVETGEGFVERRTAAFVKRLEEYVRRYPGHYLGFLAFRRFMEEHGDAPFFKSWHRNAGDNKIDED
ncbi:MAG: lysophospholipid acyltransferase family protein [Deltaproteobacteria bacterium]|nr:lysophospholipid acyltransferase family protein [Deltaproteobacteria bacterium]